MPDQLYLSYWIRGFNEENMLREYQKMLRSFPFSKLAKADSVLTILPLGYSEATLLEEAYPSPLNLEAVFQTANEHVHDDCAYQLDSWWDLWQYEEDWRVLPARVTLCCFGPQFESEFGDHLRVELGHDLRFLPRPDLPGGARIALSNIRSLLHLAHELDEALGPVERRLWSESGENFAARLEQILREAS